MGKKYDHLKSEGVGSDRHNRGDKGWDNPRDDDRTPERRDPNMDYKAIRTSNDKK